MDELIKRGIDYISARWHRKSTLPILLLFSLIVTLLVLAGINIQQVTANNIWVICFILSTIALIWISTNLTPKASKGKIGFAIGIKADSPEKQLKIKRDFIEELRSLLNGSRYRYSFDFIEIPDWILEKVNSPDAASKMIHELECSFMVYGKARSVTLKGQAQYVLDLEGVVAHKPIPNEISKTFSKEFADLFPKRLIVSSEGDLFSFEFTASWVNVVSKYIIGIAALISGDVEYAQELLESLQISLREAKTELPAIIKIRNRLPRRLQDVYLLRVQLCYEDWRKTKNVEDMEKMKPFLDALVSISPANPDARIFFSMWYFIVAKDIAKAKAECAKTKSKQNISWRYNYAFLFAYEGNLERAYKEYKQAFRGYYSEPGFIFDIVDFILWVLDREPNKTQLYFCLGLIYYYVIGDFSLALQDLEKFLESSQPKLFSSQRDEAEKLIAKIQKNIETGKIKLTIT